MKKFVWGAIALAIGFVLYLWFTPGRTPQFPALAVLPRSNLFGSAAQSNTY